MKVLKFGGTSVGTVQSLRNVKNIVDSLDEPAVVVVSALGGLTDKLIATARMASEGDPDFKTNMREMSERHFEIIEEMVPSDLRANVIEVVGSLLSEVGGRYRVVWPRYRIATIDRFSYPRCF